MVLSGMSTLQRREKDEGQRKCLRRDQAGENQE